MCHGELFEAGPSLVQRVVERFRHHEPITEAIGEVAVGPIIPEADRQALSARFASQPPEPQLDSLYHRDLERMMAERRWEAFHQSGA